MASYLEPVVSAALRTATDVGRFETAKDAKFEFDRCATDADFARWARKWGEAFVMHRLSGKTFQ